MEKSDNRGSDNRGSAVYRNTHIFIFLMPHLDFLWV